jgi:hypothetical protein
MIRSYLCLIVLVLLSSCSRNQPVPGPNITQFKAVPELVPAGITGKLCYGVENATSIDIKPHVEAVLPASDRCIDIMPNANTTYTLTAYGVDGVTKTKSVAVTVGPAVPRLSDLIARPTEVRSGSLVKVCFKVQHATSVKVSSGRLDRKTNCLTDRPRKTTTYRISALGANRQEDTGTVTVLVR